mgnify:CR=1 FL=1
MYEKNKGRRSIKRGKMNAFLKHTNVQDDVGGINRLKFVTDFIKKINNASILDVGCGTGSITIPTGLVAKKIRGIDVDKASIEIAKKRNKLPNVSFEVKDIKEEKEKYDVVLNIQVLEHLQNPESMLKEISRVTKKWAIITVPNGYGSSEIIGRLITRTRKTTKLKSKTKTNEGMFTANYDNPHIQKFRIKQLKKLANKAGLKIRKIKNHCFILGTFPINQLFFHTPLRRLLEKVDQKIANVLPHRMVNGWYVIMEKK